MRKLFISLIFLLFCGLCRAEVPLVLNFEGHQNAQNLQYAKDQLDAFKGSEIVLRVDCWTAELQPLLEVAQQIHSLKVTKKVKITVYVENRAIGPVAILPFLADVWLGTDVFVWGDILYGAHNQLPQNQLVSMVLDMIPHEPNAPLLKLMAIAMIDPSVDLKYDQKWELVGADHLKEATVFNRSQLSEMGFMIETMSPPAFVAKYGVNAVDRLPAEYASPSLDECLASAIHYHPSGSNYIGYLRMPRDRPIDQSTYLQVKFALEEYRKRNVCFVILRLNTPGGEVFPAMKIAELLQEMDARYHIPVVAVINNWALSAGAMLAYSCRFIATSNTGLMGAAEPVITGSEGKMETASEKIISALRAEFGSLAKFYGRNPLIAEAMVDKEIILVKRNGEIIELQNESDIRSEGANADELITPRGKLLTLDAEQLVQFGVADFMLPIAATLDVTKLELEVGEWPGAQSQLFTYPFFAKIPYPTLIYYQNWKIDFFAFLTHPIVASLLMMGLIIGFYMEMSSPGFGLPGIIAVICLGLILLSNFAVEAINWLEIVLIAGGVLLLLAEIFVLPGFGVIGVAGIAMILFGLFTSLVPHFEALHFSWNLNQWNLPTFEFFDRLAYQIGALVLSLLVIALLARFVTPRLLNKSKMILHGDQEGSVAGPEPKTLPPVGTEAEAFTSLRPGGKIRIEHQLYDALTEGNYIERGEKVIVSKIQGSAIIVAKK